MYGDPFFSRVGAAERAEERAEEALEAEEAKKAAARKKAVAGREVSHTPSAFGFGGSGLTGPTPSEFEFGGSYQEDPRVSAALRTLAATKKETKGALQQQAYDHEMAVAEEAGGGIGTGLGAVIGGILAGIGTLGIGIPAGISAGSAIGGSIGGSYGTIAGSELGKEAAEAVTAKDVRETPAVASALDAVRAARAVDRDRSRIAKGVGPSQAGAAANLQDRLLGGGPLSEPLQVPDFS